MSLSLYRKQFDTLKRKKAFTEKNNFPNKTIYHSSDWEVHGAKAYTIDVVLIPCSAFKEGEHSTKYVCIYLIIYIPSAFSSGDSCYATSSRLPLHWP